MEFEHIISSCFIKGRAPPTELERKSCMIRALSGQNDPEDYPRGVYIDGTQIKALEKIGYTELFHEHENYVTRQEAELIIKKFKQLIPTIKNKQVQKKIIGVTNAVMHTFGPSFVKRMGGLI